MSAIITLDNTRLSNLEKGELRMFENINILYLAHYAPDEAEYSCAVTPQVRQTGNRLSGLAGTAYASLLA